LAYAVQGALDAHRSVPLGAVAFRRFAVLVMALVLAITLAAMEAPAVAAHSTAANAPARGSQAARVLRIARSFVGARFRMGSEGMRYFDCSGLVFRAYKEAGLISKIGGGRMRVRTYMHWFQRRGLANRRNPRPGDLIVYGKRGKVTHMGIYIGGNRAISALINPWGVRTHRLNGLPDRVMMYLHVRITR